MSTDSTLPEDDQTPPADDNFDANLVDLPIEDELKTSYLTYAMSVIVSRALPDVRDGLKPSQRRILVAMNDLNLSPGSQRVKCAKISGDTSGNYHPHGESVIYPTLVRLAQEWNMRHVLIDKQGNFGSIAGLPPAAMRYTEARLSPIASLMLEDLKLDTVDYTPTYDESRLEPTVLPAKFPNLLVNGTSGIAVGMSTSIPPHNLTEICDALIRIIEEPSLQLPELLDIVKGPDFPTGGIICGRNAIRQGYATGRSTIVVQAQAEIVEPDKGRNKIIISQIPFQQFRDRVVEKIANLVNDERIKGIAEIRDESDLNDPVRLVIELKKDADPQVVLNLLYKYSPLQDSFSIILLALVDGKPRLLNLKEMLDEFLRHREEVIRRRTEFVLARARKRKHVVEGQLLALADIDKIIQIIRSSSNQAEAKAGLMGVECPASMMKEALGDAGFELFQQERGEADAYSLTAVQADAILKMTLGQLVNLEQEKLSKEFAALIDEISEYLRILSDRANIYEIIQEDLIQIRDKYGEERRTEISDIELGDVDLDDLITRERMVVTISHQGYIKRTPTSTYRIQKRGGVGLKGAKTDDEDPIEHLFEASTHDYLLFFSSNGKVYWQKVYGIPQQSRTGRGRAIVNLLNLSGDEQIMDCIAVGDLKVEDSSLIMATKHGLVKKTSLSAYSRPKKGGIIAIKLKEDDELVDVVLAKPGDEIVLSTKKGMAIRFSEADARSMGRNTSGVKGISLSKDDELVGMVVADPEATLLTACENGYGKRTLFGPNLVDISDDDESSSGSRYRTQRRGGKGLKDIKATQRNGDVVGIVRISDEDEILMISSRGQIQRIKASDMRPMGRNTQGVRIMTLGDDDTIAALVRVPPEELEGEETDPAQIESDLAESNPESSSETSSAPESAPESESESEADSDS